MVHIGVDLHKRISQLAVTWETSPLPGQDAGKRAQGRLGAPDDERRGVGSGGVPVTRGKSEVDDPGEGSRGNRRSWLSVFCP